MKQYLLLIALFFTTLCFAQRTAVDPIYGPEKEKDLTEYKPIVDALNGEYEVTYINGIAIKSCIINDISVSLSTTEDDTPGIGKHFIVNIGIQNNSGQRFNFSEENMNGYYQYKEKYGQLEKYDYKTVEKKMKRAKTWADIARATGEAATSFSESMAYTSQADVKVKDDIGREIGGAQINVRDNAQINANRSARQSELNQVDREERSYIRETVSEYLKINTIHDSTQFFSFIFFKRPKTEKIWFTIDVLGNQYVFDWEADEINN